MANDDEELVFEILDYLGTRVVCTNAQWRSKIVERHTELASRLDEVLDAISHPTLVLQDRDFPARRHFLRPAGDHLYIVVVVQYPFVQPPVVGSFVTAFFRSRLRSDDRVTFSDERR